MVRNQYHEFLRRVPLFANLSDHDLDAVGRTATELTLEPGSVLMKEGDVAHEMVVVVEGTLEVTRGGRHIAEIGPGGFAGEMALLTRATRNSTVVASTPVVIVHLDGRSFSSLLDEVPQIAVNMLPVVASRAASASDDHTC